MKIELTEREWFAIARGGIGRTSKRKIFNTIGLTNKIFDQLVSQLSPEEMEKLSQEWLSIKTEVTPTPPKVSKKVATNKNTSSRGETRVWRPE